LKIRSNLFEIFLAFLKLGCTCFGGPAAHVGYFRRELIERRGWITESTFCEFLGLTQLLPGPSSSQTGFLIGISRGGLLGGAAAWLGFTLPSFILMTAFAAGVKHATGPAAAGALRGLEIAAVAVVANAVLSMFRSLCPDWPRRVLAIIAAVFLSFNGGGFAEVAALLTGALAGWLLIRSSARMSADDDPLPVSHHAAAICLGLFGAVFVGLEIAARASRSPNLQLLDAFYRTGSLVFGGGHVVLPLLNEAVVRPGWVTPADFLAGYGAAQTIPGPLFTFAAYLGFAAGTDLHGIPGALLCTLCIFLPGLLLAAAAAPFWSWLRRHKSAQFAVSGVNAVVVGLLFSALFHAIFSNMDGGAIRGISDILLAMAAFCMLISTRVSPVIVVLAVACAEAILTFVAAK
jgi:chromate transporter